MALLRFRIVRKIESNFSDNKDVYRRSPGVKAEHGLGAHDNMDTHPKL